MELENSTGEPPLIHTWLPAQLQFVKDHFMVDMTPLEISMHFGCTVDKVHEAVALVGARYSLIKIAAFHTPGEPKVAVGIRKATRKDAYQPMSMAEFRNIYPDGLR